jgi:hypothetical protein
MSKYWSVWGKINWNPFKKTENLLWILISLCLPVSVILISSLIMSSMRNKLARNSVGIVRYADDFVVVCKTKEDAINMYEKLRTYLDKRGLTTVCIY